jgi:hypothetical protein
MDRSITRRDLPGSLCAALRSDDGIAMMTVVAISSILFVLATMLVSLAVYNSSQTRLQEARLKAVHMADAGLNAYLYELRRDPNYASTHPTLGWTTLDDGRWYVQATPAAGITPLTIRATGIIPSMPATRTIVATVRFPTYGDYMWLSNADIAIGNTATIYGRVRSNGNISNSGIVTGKVLAHGTVSGSLDAGHLQQGYTNGAPVVDFNQVSADLTAMRTAAQGSGTYFPALTGSNASDLGYRITFNGANATIEVVSAENGTTGALTVDTPVTKAINSVGVFFFDDDVWVRGNYTGSVTVGSNGNIKIPENLLPSDANQPFTCGLVAQSNIQVMSWYNSLPNDSTIYAAMLAQTGAVQPQSKTPPGDRSSITIYGSASSKLQPSMSPGFTVRNYHYDPRLQLYPPPMYPTLRDGSLNVDSWIEQ